ncbi:MAG: excinuclease ABC subunit UvrB [Spirochaetota bacterium]
MMPPFKVISPYKPSAEQQNAIDKLSDGVLRGDHGQTLLGVTGSGKTFTMAKVIERTQKPSLVLTHNKTLAAQLYREFKEFFPNNAVEYFVSYYDYYQPEAYVVHKDLYIEKDSSINDEIDRLRLMASSSILERKDVIVVSSVSCIYGLGSPEQYEKLHVHLQTGMQMERDDLLRRLITIHYDRNDIAFTRGTFRVRGDTVEIYPAYKQMEALRVEFFGDEIDGISRLHPLTGNVIEKLSDVHIYPAKHFVSEREEMKETVALMDAEMQSQLAKFNAQGKFIEAQRLESRTRYDMEMLLETGYCPGIENYSRIVSRRKPGERPECLLDYFKNDYLMLIDESHVSLPQVRGMYEGDRSRKMNLVDYGFRLPAALDNRPLLFSEFEKIINQVIYVSATPSDYELKHSTQIVEQVIRPTGLLDPEIDVRPARHQVDDLVGEIAKVVAEKERVLVTTLTKKMAEDLTRYFDDAGIRCRYLHSEIETIERVEIIRDLRKGEFDVLIGINLLREGLDIPEVSLVAILDADKEGFLRSARSLIQTSGRAARNLHGRVIMYADKVTDSMQTAIDETKRRRAIQEEYNLKYNITPKSISKEIRDIIEREYHDEPEIAEYVADYRTKYRSGNPVELAEMLTAIRQDMITAADNLEFEKAAALRDQMKEMEKKLSLLKKTK